MGGQLPTCCSDPLLRPDVETFAAMQESQQGNLETLYSVDALFAAIARGM